MARITNREFRDLAAENKFPFLDTATLTSEEGLELPNDLFLDAMLYSGEDIVLPLHISRLKGGMEDRGILVHISDNSSTLLCSGSIDPSSDRAELFDSSGRKTGDLVYSSEAMSRMADRISAETHTFTPEATALMPGRCFRITYEGLSDIGSGSTYHTDEVYLVAASGMHFTTDTVGGSTVVRVHMLGEDNIVPGAIKTVNGESFGNMWLAAHPNSAVKVSTSDSIKLEHISDVE